MNDLAASKAAARTAAYAVREAAHNRGAGAARQAAGHALCAIGGMHDVRVVSGYLPIRTEIDPLPTMLALHGLGYRICIPVIEAAGYPLRFRQWTPTSILVPGPFDVQVPADGDWLDPDVLLVPLLAFDAWGHRLGYGGGFYDRTLHSLRARSAVRGYGLAYEGQLVPEVPRAVTDAVLDGVITETGIRPPL